MHVQEFVDKMEAGTGIRKGWHAPENCAKSDVALPAARHALVCAGLVMLGSGVGYAWEALAS